MLRLQRPEPSLDQLQALAASGSSGLARRAQAQLQSRVSAKLAFELATARAQQSAAPVCSSQDPEKSPDLAHQNQSGGI